MTAFSARVARTAEGTDTLNRLSLPAIHLRTTYLDPITRLDTPLPRHQWLLRTVAPGGAIQVGAPSDAEGRSTLRPQKVQHTPGEQLELAWTPLLANGAPPPGPPWHEVWLDLDLHDWVPVAEQPAVEKRRLLRLRPWASTHKAERGGFFEAFDEQFAAQGTIRSEDLVKLRLAFGGPKRAFHIKVDYRWFRSHVQFRFYDLRARATSTVPPGILLTARDEGDAVVGAGTAIRPDGTIFVLHERTAEQSSDLHYAFELPGPFPAVDLTTSPATVVVQTPTMSPPLPTGNVETRYLLPKRWHSGGWQAAIDVRRSWDAQPEIRTADTSTAPLRFHLDDSVLVVEDGQLAELEPQTDLTVFDQLLAVRDPRPARTHVSGPPLLYNYLEAERFVYREGQDKRGLTRAFNNEGKLYDLRERRREDEAPLRARVALQNDHPWLDFLSGNPVMRKGCFELHLLDTVLDAYKYPDPLGTATRLHHLVPYSSIFIDPGEEPGAVELVRGWLGPAADVWNGGHPAAPVSQRGKLYGIVPEAGLSEGDPLVLVRHFFCERTDSDSDKLDIKLFKDGEVDAQGNIKPFRATYWEFTRTIRISPLGLTPLPPPLGDPDGMKSLKSTLPHELGHSLGYIDEYEQPIEDWILPRFSQDEVADRPSYRPFYADGRAMMRMNRLPRLRYLWHLVHALNHEPPLAGPLGFRRMRAEHRTFRGTRWSTTCRRCRVRCFQTRRTVAPGTRWARRSCPTVAPSWRSTASAPTNRQPARCSRGASRTIGPL